VGELAQAERSLHDAKAELRTLQGVQTELGAAQQQVDRLGRRVVELESQLGDQQKQTQALEAARKADQGQIQELRIELGAARAAVEAQSQLTDKIQAWLTPGPAAPAAG
jgi:peptidoglycan hydrolase CwlO-like protein